ncbi:hypothetical protein VSO92_01430 [Myroides pelagicus]|nr:hypothetical protein [Myroides pelagicus]MEC4112775.1 hypothetical protein [Myroides pelagicus]
MDNYILEIHKTLLKSQGLSNPQDRIKLINSAVALADKHNDVLWGFETRMFLINAENYTPSSRYSFPAFAWILDQHERNIGLFEEKEFLLEYKWLLGTAYGLTSISLDQIHRIANDFKEKLLANGYSLRGLYHLEALGLQQFRDFEKAKEVIALIKASPLDELSDNPPFEQTLEVFNYLGTGDIDAALIAAQELFLDRYEGLNTAFETYTIFAMEFYRIKDSRQFEYFELAQRKLPVFDSNDCITNIRSRVLYMYLLHQYEDEVCWDYFEKICIWAHESDDYYSFFFLKYASCMLKNGGKRKFSFPVYLPYYREGMYDLGELFVYFKARALEYALAFDKRNNN